VSRDQAQYPTMGTTSVESLGEELTEPPPLTTQQIRSFRDYQPSARARHAPPPPATETRGLRSCARCQLLLPAEHQLRLTQGSSRSRASGAEGHQTRARKATKSFSTTEDTQIAGCSTTLASRSTLRKDGARYSRPSPRVTSDFHRGQEGHRTVRYDNISKDEARYRTCLAVSLCSYFQNTSKNVSCFNIVRAARLFLMLYTRYFKYVSCFNIVRTARLFHMLYARLHISAFSINAKQIYHQTFSSIVLYEPWLSCCLGLIGRQPWSSRLGSAAPRPG
jgi:hypothetical protein